MPRGESKYGTGRKIRPSSSVGALASPLGSFSRFMTFGLWPIYRDLSSILTQPQDLGGWMRSIGCRTKTLDRMP